MTVKTLVTTWALSSFVLTLPLHAALPTTNQQRLISGGER
jgi:hypothetical protein